ncbi:hypothetical protein PPROV_000433500 [Pycnococcus provasolii]|uniref:Right handed beta helix domain-containing protein n=1 Tax=Pycnococcus provasolii TaxID=41880 RepID=A0A830HF39_9CHLO|nr:hypothetical protein PPROV_000433500 [Pycnococcus provasolii]
MDTSTTRVRQQRWRQTRQHRVQTRCCDRGGAVKHVAGATLRDQPQHSRRLALLGGTGVVVGITKSLALAEEPIRVRTSDGELVSSFATVEEAVAACPDGGAVLLAPGTRYESRVIVNNARSVTVIATADVGEALSPPDDQQAPPATLIHRTSTPYESVVEASGGARVSIVNVDILHSSKSVARNYAVLACEESRVSLTKSVVTSETGSGVGCEGGAISLDRVLVTNCSNHGALLQGGLEGDTWDDEQQSKPGSSISNSQFVSNGGDGVYFRDGAGCLLLKNVKTEKNAISGIHVGTGVVGGTAQVKVDNVASAGDRKGGVLIEATKGGMGRDAAEELAHTFSKDVQVVIT